MRVAIPHGLGQEEARRRLKAHGHEIADHIPGGMADVSTGWPSENRMTIRVAAMGQALDGQIDIEESQVVFELALPEALSFIEPIVEGAIRKNGQKLLEAPKD
jgi:hypothetical protein